MKNPAALIGLILSLTAAAPVYAAVQSYKTEVINNVSIGDVSIDLSESELSPSGEEIPYQNGKTVIPGDKVSKIVRIANLANPAWVRVRLQYEPDEGMRDFPDSCIFTADEHWIMRGGYYYYTIPLESGEEVEFMRELLIPPFWAAEEAGKGFTLMISAEAVQEANFDPDFSADDPWFGTLIETCVHTPYYQPVLLKNEIFSVFFEGGAEGLVKTGDDFFGNFGNLMPGDTAADMVSVRNGYSRPVALYFRTEGIAEDPLAREAQLTIMNKDGVIFKGRLSESREEVELAQLEPGEEQELIYSLFIPPECGNSYAMERTADKWIFRASLNTEEKKSTSSGGGNSGGGRTAVPGGWAKNIPGPGGEPFIKPGGLAQTGEGTGLAAAMILTGITGLFLLILGIFGVPGAGSSSHFGSVKHGTDPVSGSGSAVAESAHKPDVPGRSKGSDTHGSDPDPNTDTNISKKTKGVR